MIIDGRTMAREVLARAKARAERFGHAPRVLAIVADETPATKSYLAIKQKKAEEAGCSLIVQHIKSSLRPLEVFDMATTAVRASDADAIIVQLPLPEGVDTKAVCDAIPLAQDADVLSSASRTEGTLLPPVVGAVKEILEYGKVGIEGKKAVVVGRGFLVGAPVAMWLKKKGAEVTVMNRSTENLSDLLREADIIVSGAGSPHLIKPGMLKGGVVLIDAGTSESGGAIVGDADPACAEKCSLFTPVPGGVGPLAVAKLFENVVALTEMATNK